MQKNLKKLFMVICAMFFSSNNILFAKQNVEVKSVLKIMYFNETMGNVHQNASRYSQTLTSVSCNHPIKVLRIQSAATEQVFYGNGEWVQVQAGPYEGFLLKDLLSDSKVECFQDQYPKFFEEMNMSITDLYYLGRLNDQYLTGKSKAPDGALIPRMNGGKP